MNAIITGFSWRKELYKNYFTSIFTHINIVNCMKKVGTKILVCLQFLFTSDKRKQSLIHQYICTKTQGCTMDDTMTVKFHWWCTCTRIWIDINSQNIANYYTTRLTIVQLPYGINYHTHEFSFLKPMPLNVTFPLQCTIFSFFSVFVIKKFYRTFIFSLQTWAGLLAFIYL